jgi:4-hydroxy-3-methylbut-2-enyl diphosphate reductase IspH
MAHLLAIPRMAGIQSFHINHANYISADNTIMHQMVKGEIVMELFLMDMSKDVVMGVTLGASTSDAVVQDSMSQIFFLTKMSSEMVDA